MDQYLARQGVSAKDGNRVRQLDALLLSQDKTFRSVFYYRCKARKGLYALSKLSLPPVREIEIYGDIDGGLMLLHNYMVVHPDTAGKNLCVAAGTVIGVNNGQFPTIGSNVTIEANATVIGGITIGDNVTIEAGSVVTKSLAPDAVYGGNPAVLIRKKSDKASL